MEEEIWKPIRGYEGTYEASNLGNIRSVDGRITLDDYHGMRRWHGRVLKGRGDHYETGKRVNLWKGGVSQEFLVARLVALTFLGEPTDGYTVNHIDGNRLNNRIENLEWLSLADNIRHGFRTGLYASTQKQIRLTRNGATASFVSLEEANRFLGRCHGYVSNAIQKNHKISDVYGATYTVPRSDSMF